MIDVELTEPHHVTVGTVGEPGNRTFFVQAQDDAALVTLVLEKQQVGGIGDLLAQLLARIEDRPATDWDRAAMALREPIDPRWRIGELGVGIDDAGDRFVLEFTELLVAEDEVELAGLPEPREVRIWLDQDQARRLAAHADELVGQGRPRCQFCGRPMAADGSHVCPSTNGHGRLTR